MEQLPSRSIRRKGSVRNDPNNFTEQTFPQRLADVVTDGDGLVRRDPIHVVVRIHVHQHALTDSSIAPDIEALVVIFEQMDTGVRQRTAVPSAPAVFMGFRR